MYSVPFTVEEVEDVKTFVKLMVVVVSSTAYIIRCQCKIQANESKNLLS